MLENFYDIETDDEEYERLILKAQFVAAEGREVLAEAENQLLALRPMLVETEERVRQWSQWLDEARANGNSTEEAECLRGLEECMQFAESLHQRIQTLEQVKTNLTEHLMWIKAKATHA
ncbi:MAG: hypothetical protein DI628_07195 [Blastochloris viridis]|uniref:Uncharacterized protein n=1 Tax=Blastochloris viridis TaxID=1079 RepID=A0A6N4QZF6_BLAVI|nr:MAG: hypothetical protein DI628_07195 [Blastochloris viridis]